MVKCIYNANRFYRFTVTCFLAFQVGTADFRAGGSAASGMTVNIDLGGAASGTIMTDRQALPPSTFLSGARQGIEYSGSSVADFMLAGAFGAIYPGISLAVYVDEHHIEYSFLLTTGADPSRIRFRLNEMRLEAITSEGHMIYTRDGLEVYQRTPSVFSIDSEGNRRTRPGRLTLIGDNETSVTSTESNQDNNANLNGTLFNLVTTGSGRAVADYDFYMSRFELTNEQWIRFLNDAQLNNRNPRGANMFFDEAGNIWIHPQMQPGRDELYQIDFRRIRYFPDRAPGDCYTHFTDTEGHQPFSDHPATGISWYGAVKYCNWLTLQSGRGLHELCYREGTNTWDWAPVTATNWTNGFFSEEERHAWIAKKGFRLPMSRMHYPDDNGFSDAFNEFLKAGSWNGSTNVSYGFGRNVFATNDANTLEAAMLGNHETLPVGFFTGRNQLISGKARYNENAFGIHDLTGNVSEWLNDPWRPGVPDSRSLAGGSFAEQLRPLTHNVLTPPSTTDKGVGFRPITTFMPESLTHVSILFCFHSDHRLKVDYLDRFNIGSLPEVVIHPTEESPQPAAPDDLLIPGPGIDQDDSQAAAAAGILYKGDAPEEPDPDEPEQPVDPVRPPGPGENPFPPPPPLFVLDVFSRNPDSRVPISISRLDFSGQSDGITSFRRQYEYGSSVTLTAPASINGNVFQYWLRNGVPFETSTTITLQMLSDLQLTAFYLSPAPPVQRILIIDSTPEREVPITIQQEDNNGLQGGNTRLRRIYDDRTPVTVTAPITFNGENFLGWLRNGNPISNNPTITIEMLSNITLTARYGQSIAENERSLTVTSLNPDGGVQIDVSIPDLTGNQDGNTSFNRRYDFGATVTLTAPALASNGNRFVRWLRNNDAVSDSLSITLQMQTDLILTAEYEQPPLPVNLAVNSSNPGSGVQISISTADINTDSDGITSFNRVYNSGTPISLSAPQTAPNGNEFFYWVLNGTVFSTNQTIAISMLADTELTAVFRPPSPPPITRNLSVTSQDPSSGVLISVSAPDIDTGDSDGQTAFNRTYLDVTEVELTAPVTAPNGHVFTHWLVDGELYSNQETITLTMGADRSAIAVYSPPLTPIQHQLTVQSRNPNSTILITVDPADVNGQQNGSTPFSRLYDDGITVNLTARNPAFPSSSNVFRQWEVDGTTVSTNVNLSIIMWQNTTVTAVYGPAIPTSERRLTVTSLNPDNSVLITISAPDIVSGETDGLTQFDRIYSNGTPVTVSAPAVLPNRHRFTEWRLNGTPYSPDNTITLNMLSDMLLTAVYELPFERTLTVLSRNPDSGVSIAVDTEDNQGLQHGNTAFERIYDDGQSVVLSAPSTAPNGRDVFLYWERNGTQVTSNSTVSVSLVDDVEMTAVYGPPSTYQLTVQSENPNSQVPIDISTPDVLGRTDGLTRFDRTYNPGAQVTVTAPETSPNGSTFQHWLRNGSIFSYDLSLDISMLTDSELTAVYGPPEPVERLLVILSINPESEVPIIISPNDKIGLGNGETSLQRTYFDGQTVTFTAPAIVSTNTFRQWLLNGSPLSANLTESVTMLQDHQLIAVYGPPAQPQERILIVDSRNPFSGVPISVSQPDISGQANGDTVFVRIYQYGQSTTLTAPEISGTNNTEFLRWEMNGEPYSNDRIVTIEMFSDVQMTVVYEDAPRPVTLTVESQNPDTGVLIGIAPEDNFSEANGETTFERIYLYGQNVILSAPPVADNRPFLHWLYNDIAISTEPVYNVNMFEDITMTAVYGDPDPVEELLMTIRSRGPDGPLSTLIGTTADINGAAGGTTEFQRTYESGTGVTISAPPTSNGLNFDHWEIGGTPFSNNQTISFSMLQNITVTAVYVDPQASPSGL